MGKGGGGGMREVDKIKNKENKTRVIQHTDPLQSLLLSQENKYTGRLPSAFSPSTGPLPRDDLSI